MPKKRLPYRGSEEAGSDLLRRLKGKARMEDEVNGMDQDEEPRRGKLVDESLACRYLAAQCLVSSSMRTISSS
jgi:hypothetical protein